MEELGREYIKCARYLSANGWFSKAFKLYVAAFEKCPQLKIIHETECSATLLKMNDLLASENRMEEIFKNFELAHELYPNSVHLWNDIGKYLYRFSFYTYSWKHFEKALELDPNYVDAEKNLNSIKNVLVERWHFRMLNDKVRNDAYRSAIHETLIPAKDSVLDLGTGTGILAIYARECNPMSISGCDGSKTMAHLAEKILNDNNIFDIIIVNNMSTKLNYKDIRGKKSLVITEVFDAGLFGEHVLQTLSHAWQNLISNVGRVLPRAAEFFVVGVKSDTLIRKYQLTKTAKEFLNIPTLYVNVKTNEDSYDCDDVYLFQDLKYMTHSKPVVKVDFNDYHDIQEKLNRSKPFEIELKAIESGEINAIIGWFNLYLTDHIIVTTDPQSPNRANAWQQAVFIDDVPSIVKQDETMRKVFLMNEGKMSMIPDHNNKIIQISAETIRFLNDYEYINAIKSCIDTTCVYLRQLGEISDIAIVDLNPFPIFGLLMLMRGARSLLCHLKVETDKIFFDKVFTANNVPLSKIKYLIENNWTEDSFTEQYHAIYCNVLDIAGDIDPYFKQIAQHLKNNHLVPGGLFLPAKIDIYGQLVNSHWIDVNNRVYDENVHNYNITKHLTKYEVSQNFCQDFANLEYTPLSDPVLICDHETSVRSDLVDFPIVKDGFASAILCWFNIQIMEDLTEFATNKSYCFMDSSAFIINSNVFMTSGKTAHIKYCFDSNGSFKLVLHEEAT